MKMTWVISGVLAVVCAGSARGQAAAPMGQQPPVGATMPSMDVTEGMGPSPHTAASQAERRNEERQRRLVEDTDKLYALATQLKSEVQKTNKDILSVDVVKKAEEIEKLAKSVKERMKGQV